MMKSLEETVTHYSVIKTVGCFYLNREREKGKIKAIASTADIVSLKQTSSKKLLSVLSKLLHKQ